MVRSTPFAGNDPSPFEFRTVGYGPLIYSPTPKSAGAIRASQG
jgi:hypothetical protein